MSKVYPIAILGCGDYLRWEHGTIKKSKRVKVKTLFDPAAERAAHYGEFFGARPAASADAVFGDDEIEIVLIFTPPWVRRDLVLKAVEAGKHIITVKPLAPNLSEATAMVKAVGDKVDCAVFYRRTGDARVDALKRVFDSGEIGRLALYREDWLHHYPTWNKWATDPAKNGGPFMDAMVHNLNIARYLAGTEATACAFFSDNHAQHLQCNDTESMKVDFEGGASAHLFITWAADLAIYDANKNEREHIDIWYMVTDQGWHVTLEGGNVKASKDGKVKTWPVQPPAGTPYDGFVAALEAGGEQPFGLVDAWKDIAIMDAAAKNVGRTVPLDLTPPK
jgi:predicted dehydrogenase